MLKPYDQKRDNNKVFYNEGCAGRQTANNTPFVHFVDDKIAKKKRGNLICTGRIWLHLGALFISLFFCFTTTDILTGSLLISVHFIVHVFGGIRDKTSVRHQTASSVNRRANR